MAGTDEKGIGGLRDFLDLIEDNGLRNFLSNRSTKIKIEWYLYARYYLRAADLLLTAAGQKVEDKNQIITSLFNLRHSLELVLKATQKFIDSDQIEEKHDIRKLFDTLKSRMIPVSGKAAKQLAKELGIQEEQAKKSLEESLEKLSNIVIKYYYQIPMVNKLNKDSYYIEDVDNELFRYPEAKKIKFTILSQGIIVNFTEKDVERIKKDIKTIKSALNILFLALAISEKESLSKEIEER